MLNKKCGWFCRNRNAIRNVVSAIQEHGWGKGALSVFAQEWVARVALKVGFSFTNTEIPLTRLEESILDAWVSQQFQPFAESLNMKVDKAIGTVNSTNIIKVFNDVKTDIAILKAWVTDTTKKRPARMTANMILARNQLIHSICEDLENSIQFFLTENSISPTISKISIRADSITSSGTMIYNWSKITQATYETFKITPFTVIVQSVTTTAETIIDDVKDIVISIPIEDIPTDATPNQETPKEQLPASKYELPLVAKVLGFAVAGLVIKKIVKK